MQPIERKELARMIEEAKVEGKDTSSLEQLLNQKPEIPTMGEVRQLGDQLIISTGPARREDFEQEQIAPRTGKCSNLPYM